MQGVSSENAEGGEAGGDLATASVSAQEEQERKRVSEVTKRPHTASVSHKK
jgi:hypothetical protein